MVVEGNVDRTIPLAYAYRDGVVSIIRRLLIILKGQCLPIAEFILDGSPRQADEENITRRVFVAVEAGILPSVEGCQRILLERVCIDSVLSTRVERQLRL